MKICIVTPLFAISGVPLAQIRFARAWAARGHEVDLLIGNISSEYTFPDIPGIRLINFNKKNVRSMFYPLYTYLRSAKPDIVFSAEDHLNTTVLIAAICARSKAKFSGSSRVTPFDTYSNVPLTKRWFLKWITRAVMWRADALTCVSKDMVEQYKIVFPNSPHVPVYNIVEDSRSLVMIKEQVNHEWLTHKKYPVLIAAGRLAPWKGFLDLIQAVAIVSKSRPVRLILLGDGPQKLELEKLIIKLGLSEFVSLLGYVENPLKYFSHADVFVLSSYVEGMPNVLIEAMMCGCTVVATDCPTGPREVLQGGRYGYLVPVSNPAALAKCIEQALDNPIPKGVLKEAVLPFEEHAVIARHLEVLNIPLN
jgi:glycosyltransferase involved in cell wall biosynthesis